MAPKILLRLLFLDALGSKQFSQKKLKTIVYAKFEVWGGGGLNECIVGHSKIREYVLWLLLNAALQPIFISR